MKNKDSITHICIRLVSHLPRKNPLQMAEWLAQFIKFCLIGISNTALSYVLNIVVLKILESFSLSFDYVIANLVAFFLSVVWSFFWNSRFVFQTKNRNKRVVLKMLFKTYIAYSLTGIILNNILSWLWIEKLGISKYMAPLINLIISVPINFLMNKLWAFKEQ